MERIPVGNIVSQWMGDNTTLQQTEMPQPVYNGTSAPMSQAQDSETAAADSLECSKLILDLSQIITAERHEILGWMGRIDRKMEALGTGKGYTQFSDVDQAAPSASRIEFLIREEFQKQHKWLEAKLGTGDLSAINDPKPNATDSDDVKVGFADPESPVRHDAFAEGEERAQEAEVRGFKSFKSFQSLHTTRTGAGQAGEVRTPQGEHARGVKHRANQGTCGPARGMKTERARMFEYLQRVQHAQKDHWIVRSLTHPAARPANALVDIVDSTYFIGASIFVVVLNAVWIGFQTSWQMDCLLSDGEFRLEWRWINRMFSLIYVIELCMRLCAYRWSFFVGTDYQWNIYDLLVVCMAILEEAHRQINLSFLRSLRIIRLVQVTRVFRVLRFCQGIRYLLCSMVASMSLLFWLVLFIFFSMYCCAIVFMQGIVTYWINDNSNAQFLSEEQLIKKYYKSVGHTMLTLLMAITGGQPWEKLVHPLQEAHPMMLGGFVVYIVFMIFGVCNVLTAIFVETAKENRQHDRDLAIHKEMEDGRAFGKALRSFFRDKGMAAVDELTAEDLDELLDDRELQLFLQVNQIDCDEAEDLFFLLDVENDGRIGVDDFVFGCLRLKGLAKGMDVVLLNDQFVEMARRISAMTDRQRALAAQVNVNHHYISAEHARTRMMLQDFNGQLEEMTTAFKERKAWRQGLT